MGMEKFTNWIIEQKKYYLAHLLPWEIIVGKYGDDCVKYAKGVTWEYMESRPDLPWTNKNEIMPLKEAIEMYYPEELVNNINVTIEFALNFPFYLFTQTIDFDIMLTSNKAPSIDDILDNPRDFWRGPRLFES
jgi:hypothetical protein